MDIRPLSPAYAVSPQIEASDMLAIRQAGFTTVICNRPDAEIPPGLRATAMASAAEAAGLAFVVNPVTPGDFNPGLVTTQIAALTAATGPVLAYCASGNRSAIVWSLIQTPEIGVDAVLKATRAAGYDHSPMRPFFEAMSAKG